MNESRYSQQSSLTSTSLSEQISQKRYQFYFQIKQKSRQTMMRNIRCKYLKQQRNQKLTWLINQTQLQISQHQLQRLFQFATKHKMTNAIIYIGNLFLDQVLDHRVFELMGSKWLYEIDINCGYYQWLLNILVQRKCVDSEFGVYYKMVNQLSKNTMYDQFRILNGVKCLTSLIKTVPVQFCNNLITKYSSNFAQAWRNQNLNTKSQVNITHVLKFCINSNQQISKQAWRFANNLFSQQIQQASQTVILMYGVEKMLTLIRNGLMSVYSHIRILACQILTNNLGVLVGYVQVQNNSNVQNKLNELIQQCYNLVLSSNEKQSVKLQISYLLLNLIQISTIQQISYAYSHGFIKIIQQLHKSYKLEPENQINEKLQKNCVLMCKMLADMCYNYRRKNCMNQYGDFIVQAILCELGGHGLLIGDEEMGE